MLSSNRRPTIPLAALLSALLGPSVDASSWLEWLRIKQPASSTPSLQRANPDMVLGTSKKPVLLQTCICTFRSATSARTMASCCSRCSYSMLTNHPCCGPRLFDRKI
ncbi:hypothetical protein BKA66DRAFT_458859, partial [Pyrenochaeta sp. MPI-SDFR-AT-0127]